MPVTPAVPARGGAGERIVIPRVGGPDVLTPETFAPGAPGPGEVAIEVAAVGINLADVFCRLGLYKAAPAFPFSPGFEVSGVIRSLGDGVSALAVGDRVVAVTRFGGYTTHLVIGAEWVRPLPAGWSMEEGAAFPVVFLTAHHGLVTIGHLAAGETVVVQSAAGGVGTAACQLARALGARVIGTVGSEAKRAVALEAGAEHVVVSRDYDVWGEIDRLTGGTGVDVVFDAVGGPGLRRGFDALRPGGRLIVYGFAEMLPRGGRRNWPVLAWRYLRMPRFNPLQMTQSNRTVGGFNLVYLWGRPVLFTSAIGELMGMVARKEIRPVVGRTFPFARAGEAHAFLQSRRSTGKVVLVT
jgi:NADPH:quinone reductase-like Zn-dependent oxidoreductase